MSRTAALAPFLRPAAAPLRPAAGAAVRAARSLLLATFPQGGQQAARRNAWAAMSTDAGMARARRDSRSALDRAALRADLRAPADDRVARAH